MTEPIQKPISADTRLCAVLGHPIRHSASPAMQTAGIAALGLNWRYLAFDVLPEQLGTAIAGARAMKFVGLNLTVPHKVPALKMVEVLDESAKMWGAVNTIRFETLDHQGRRHPPGPAADEIPDGRIIATGYNTDAEAIMLSLREDLGLECAGAKVLVLGTGGAGRVAALKLSSEKIAELFLVNRTQAKAEEIAREIRQRFPNVKVTLGYPQGAVDLTLNATSLGLRPDDPLPLDETRFAFHQTRAVFDMIYRPAETRLLKAAQVAGCRVANGLSMLLYQGAKALEIWSGRPAPVEVMRRVLKQHVYLTQ